VETRIIETLDDPRIAGYRAVRDADLRGGHTFLAEGRHNVRRLLTVSRFRTRSVFVTPAGLEGIRDALLRAPRPAPVYLASQRLMNDVVGYDMHRGCLAEGERGPEAELESLWDMSGQPPRLCVVLEDVTNPENVGGVFRNALAFGAGAVLLTPRSVDPLYRRSIRVSMGAALRVPFARAARWPEELPRLRAAGVAVVALEARRGGALPLAELELPAGTRGVALLVGCEGSGLSQAARQQASICVTIPMAPGIDSLNTATATGIALHHLAGLVGRAGSAS